MLRPAIAAISLAFLAAVAHASELPRRIGMYPTGGGGAALPMLESKVEVIVRGPIVETIVTQEFRNDTDHVTEATYIFPLPVDAAVSAMSIRDGSRTIHAAIERRAEAQRRYEEAVAAGLGAGLLDQERPDVFTQTVSAIPPHGTVSVTLRYDSTATYRAGSWELVLPMVVAPRYVPGGASGRPTTGGGRSPDTDRAPDASRVTPGGAPGAAGKTTVAIRFVEPVDGVTSATHEVSGTGMAYAFVDPKTDHDAVVRWRAPAPASGWVEQDADGGYAAVVVAAASPLAQRKGVARYTLMLDRAATMRGDADLVARLLVRDLVGGAERVAVIGSNQIPAGTGADVEKVLEEGWSRAVGAFDLTRVLASAQGGGPFVLVTDGLVADDAAAIAAAAKLGVPIHVVGVGPAPNRSLLTAIASRTHGTVRFALPGDDYAALAREVLADVMTAPESIAVSWGTLAASDVVPATLPRVGAGQSVLVLARVRQAHAANARAHGELFAIEAMGRAPAVDGATSPHGPLARRWARMRLDELLAAGDRNGAALHAMHYGLVSPLTSMVAIGTEVVMNGGVKHSVSVPVSVPAGMRWQEVRREISVDVTKSKGNRHEKEKEDDEVATDRKKLKSPDKKPEPKHATRPESTGTGAAAGGKDEEKDGDDVAGEEPSAKAPQPPPMSPTRSVSSRDDADSIVETAGETTSMGGRHVRFSVGLGAGATFHGTTGALLSLSTRIELGRRTLFGGELTGGLVDGAHGQLRILGTVARRGFITSALELGVGGGVETADGAGPAGALSLRFRPSRELPVHVYLRYDASLIYHAGARATEQDLTLGLEWHF